ncbi:response regulator transcription factor [Peptoniphilus catoniae]|uniref:response regulator transcription factor n=1 Tax=Peptoniphilus catoniae TaxID=1660341 RepID=UPI0010FEE7D5|nr:response regulator transcription factor [Peptoniphilus catoniae]
MKILIVEDEKELNDTLAKSLRLSGYSVTSAYRGDEAEELSYVNSYNLIILDLNLPGMSGFDLLKKIRQRDKIVNIIILTARSQVDDRVKGLDLGANDYMVKPFYTEELEARIRNLLRRSGEISSYLIKIGEFTFDTKNRTAYADSKEIKLTPKELGILEYLLLSMNRYVTIEELMEHIWEDDLDFFSNTARVHMVSLRKKLRAALGKDLIENKIGRGYIINEKK